jgi:hypothetical protein
MPMGQQQQFDFSDGRQYGMPANNGSPADYGSPAYEPPIGIAGLQNNLPGTMQGGMGGLSQGQDVIVHGRPIGQQFNSPVGASE